MVARKSKGKSKPTQEADQSTTSNKQSDHESERRQAIKVLENKIRVSNHRLHVIEQSLNHVFELKRLAEDGDEAAIVMLSYIIDVGIGSLNYTIAEKYPELVRKLARPMFLWPAWIGRKAMLRQVNEELMDHLQLGQGGAIFSERKWQLSAPSTQIAFGLLARRVFKEDWTEKPRLTRIEKRQLFEALWAEMLAEGIVPEETPRMAALGKSAIGKNSTSRGMSEQTLGMRANDVRAEIKRQVWKAFDRLVPHANRTK